MSLDFIRARQLADDALTRHLPRQRNDAWLAQMVDPPRFGWDWESLERGFLGPLSQWADRHDARLRPALCAMLMQALGADPQQHQGELAALELHYLAAIMLDDLRNGRDLDSSRAAEVDIPLPVWVTIAYNVRQLAPVMASRLAPAGDDPRRVEAAQALARFLFAQGLGSTLDLWWEGHPPDRLTLPALLSHLGVYVGSLSFGLTCQLAAVAAGDGNTEVWADIGRKLGVSLRLGALSRGEDRQLRCTALDSPCIEQRIRLQHGLATAALRAAGEDLADQALAQARHMSEPAARALAGFGRLFEPTWFTDAPASDRTTVNSPERKEPSA